ncbi:MAG TPA: YHS domain-containing protein [Anaerolineae bacterium]|nr:YHS domain-containing protein [Anaerolineae bacterium]
MHEHQEQTQPTDANEHIDPVCGMTVEEGPNALTMDYNGTKYYFCGPGCRRSFEKDPEKYLKEGPSMHM